MGKAKSDSEVKSMSAAQTKALDAESKAARNAAALAELEGSGEDEKKGKDNTWSLQDPPAGRVLLLSVYPTYNITLRAAEYEPTRDARGRKVIKTKGIYLDFKDHKAVISKELLDMSIGKPMYGINFVVAQELKFALQRRKHNTGFSLELGKKQAEGFVADLVRRSDYCKSGKLTMSQVLNDLAQLELDAELVKETLELKKAWHQRDQDARHVRVG